MTMFGGDSAMTIVVKAKNEASKVFKEMEKNTKDFKNNIDKMQPTFKKMALVGGAAFVGITAGIGKAVKEFAKFEQAEVAFESLLGSAEKAKDLMEDLSKFTAKTPFRFEDVAQSTRTLLSFGVEAENLNDKLQLKYEYI